MGFPKISRKRRIQLRNQARISKAPSRFKHRSCLPRCNVVIRACTSLSQEPASTDGSAGLSTGLSPPFPPFLLCLHIESLGILGCILLFIRGFCAGPGPGRRVPHDPKVWPAEPDISPASRVFRFHDIQSRRHGSERCSAPLHLQPPSRAGKAPLARAETRRSSGRVIALSTQKGAFVGGTP